MMNKGKALPLLLLLLLFAPPRAAAMDTKPLLYSLVLPGMGEWSLGHRGRALTHFAVEAGCWAGNFYYRDRGFQLRHDYEAYAEAHWEEARWASAWNAEQPEWMDWISPSEWEAMAEYWNPVDGVDPTTALEFDASHEGYLQSHFAPYHEDPQHYYENLGKYDWYRWGWDDYGQGMADDSSHRYVYGAMRNDSNDAFSRAHSFITVMVMARVVSLVDTYLILHRLESGASRADLDRAWRLEFQPGDPREAQCRLALTRRW